MSGFIINPYAFGSSSGGDPYWSDVVLLVSGAGSNGQTTFTDLSPIARTVSRFGDAQVSTSNNYFTGGALLLDGTGDYLQVPSSSDFSFADGDFCIEFWLRMSSALTATSQVSIGRRNNNTTSHAFTCLMNSTDGLRFDYRPASTTIAVTTGFVPSATTWHHVAYDRNGADLRIFADGVQRGSTHNIGTSSLNSGGTETTKIGAVGNTAAAFLNAMMQELRVTRHSRYTADFTPPAARFPRFGP